MKYLSIVFIILFQFKSFSQSSNESFYAFDKNWQTIQNLDKSTYFMQKVRENDTTYISRIYRTKGSMVSWETFKDSALSIKNGFFAWYNQYGELDSSGNYTNNVKDKKWKIAFDKKLNPLLALEYKAGEIIRQINYKTKTYKWNSGKEEPIELNDPNHPDYTIKVNDNQAPATFINGGIEGWMNFINNNIITPNRFISISGPNSVGRVKAGFLIQEDGQLTDIQILQSREWSADMEVIRMLKSSPSWKPAFQNGKNIPYNFAQTFTFNVGN